MGAFQSAAFQLSFQTNAVAFWTVTINASAVTWTTNTAVKTNG